MTDPSDASPRERIRWTIRGTVQGVGFRPFVYRVARELGLSGFVANTNHGVVVEVEGDGRALEIFGARLVADRPPHCRYYGLEQAAIGTRGETEFTIRPSPTTGSRNAIVLPDIATCADCLREMRDPGDRRYRYPFTNCTHCGPRFTIILDLPYDRPNTTMRGFAMCPDCRAEYEDPGDRRFHAQPVACPACGPGLALWNPAGAVLSSGEEALAGAVDAIRRGLIVGVQGLGGFHLIVDARDADAVGRLRERKHREQKPLALLFPDLDAVRAVCEVSEVEARQLSSPESPIVLLRRARPGEVAEAVAPGNPCLGAMLPYTPLHHLLIEELAFPVVATSGNLSEEPICIAPDEAVRRLGGIVDLLLVHDRPIARQVDDSVVRVVAERLTVLRRARGFAPLPVPLAVDAAPTLAVGAHLKNTVALSVGGETIVSQHIGDLETAGAAAAFERIIGDLTRFYGVGPERVICDAHPDYLSTRWAESSGHAVLRCQHHLAHVLSCLAENEVSAPALGVVWDGTGYGEDGTVWGGEFLAVDGASWRRVARFRHFGLPGGDRAVVEPRRAAFGLLRELYGDELPERDDFAPVAAFEPGERAVLAGMLERGVNAPRTSSVGRLFDAVASITGLCQKSAFEAQAAMAVEFAAEGGAVDEPYATGLHEARDGTLVVDWEPMVRGILEDLASDVAVATVASRFHEALADAAVTVARRAGIPDVALSGGCFQNRRLAERTGSRLERAGFRVLRHQRIPPNDGGIALGQIAWAARQVTDETLRARAGERRGAACLRRPPRDGEHDG